MAIKVVLYMSMSVNGMIATEDYGEDFLDDTWKYLVELGGKYGAVIWGRTTYELVNKMPAKYTDLIKNFKKIVISSNKQLSLKPDDQVFSSIEEAMTSLEKQGYQEVMLSGGSKINSAFAKLNLIDEVKLVADSVIIGKGIPLFFPEDFQLRLEPIEVELRDGHLVYLHYRVKKLVIK